MTVSISAWEVSLLEGDIDRLAQLVEYWTTMWEVMGSNPGRTTIQGGESAAFVMTSVMVRLSSPLG